VCGCGGAGGNETPAAVQSSYTLQPAYVLQQHFMLLLRWCRLSRPFDAVLIDEACQAAEVSALQPLVYGTNKVGRWMQARMQQARSQCSDA
jgi:hypothetical protein